MWMYFLWYLLTGIVLIVATAVVSVVGLCRKYGLDITAEAIDWVHDHEVAKPECTGEWVTFTIIGLLLWPLRLADSPSLTSLYWEKCEEIKNREPFKEMEVVDECLGS